MAFYGTVGGADDYHGARLNAAWTGTPEAKTAALVRASAYVDSRGRYTPKCGPSRSLFPGEKTGGRNQERQWPRTGAVDADGNEIPAAEVPVEIEQATYEAALRELTAPGSLSPDFVPAELVTKEKVDVVEVTYAAASSAGGTPPTSPVLPVVDALLAALLRQNCCGPAVFVV